MGSDEGFHQTPELRQTLGLANRCRGLERIGAQRQNLVLSQKRKSPGKCRGLSELTSKKEGLEVVLRCEQQTVRVSRVAGNGFLVEVTVFNAHHDVFNGGPHIVDEHVLVGFSN